MARGAMIASPVMADGVERAREPSPAPSPEPSIEHELRRQLDTAQSITHIGSWEWTVASSAVIWSDELYRIYGLSLIHISEPTRLLSISYAVFCLKKKKKN